MLQRDPATRPRAADALKKVQALMAPVKDENHAFNIGKESRHSYGDCWARHYASKENQGLFRLAHDLSCKYAAEPLQPDCDPCSDTLKGIHDHAVLVAPEMLRAMQGFVQRHQGRFKCPPPVGEVSRGFIPPESKLRNTVKRFESAENKMREDYDGNHRRVVNHVRASGIFKTTHDIEKVLEDLQNDGPLRVV